ncbi:MAG: hypothetical protein KF745_13635 [Phycisphaeraceae bacterium]|nr:hypothetical protein [Phycisphaeraceae bacterium]
MPIDPRTLNRPAVYVTEDRACVGCGYNLIGLRTNQPCPECGRPIYQKSKGAFNEHVVEAPLEYLTLLRLGGALMFFGYVGMIVSLFIAGKSASPLGSFPLAAAAVAWWLGVVVVTRPRPVMPSMEANPATEWVAIRLSARITQAFWPLFAALAAIAALGSRAPISVDILSVLASIALLVAAAGMLPVCLQLNNLSYWARDSWSFYALRTLSIAGPISCFLGPATVSNGLPGLVGIIGSPSAPEALVYIVLFAIFVVIPQGVLVVTLFRFYQIGRWAVTNHDTSAAREQRFLDRFAEAERNRPAVVPDPDPYANIGSALPRAADHDSAPLSSGPLKPAGRSGVGRKKYTRPDDKPPVRFPMSG